MFERFTDNARRVIVLAQDAARDMGHGQIKPEHLLVGLRQGEGMAAGAMAKAGVDGAALRERVAALYENRASAKKMDKVPFSVEGKRCLEQSLRAALALGHNYIGTEHLFFGVQRRAEADDRPLDELLGASATEISRRLTEALSDVAMRSPALRAALTRARARAGQSPLTTGHVLAGMLSDPRSQVSRALSELGLDRQRVQAALDAVDLTETSDAGDAPQSIAITIGGRTTVIADPDLAAALRALNAEQVREVIKRAIGRAEPGQAAG